MITFPAQDLPRTAVVAVISAVLCIIVIASAFEIYSSREEAADDGKRLAELRGEISASPQFLSDYRQTRQRLANHPYLFTADSTVLAGARMERDIKAIVSRGGGDVRTEQLLPANRSGDLEIVSSRYDLVVPVNKLQDVVYGIESHIPLLKIDNAEITAPEYQLSGSTNNPTKLDVRLTIHGYRWAGRK